MFIGQYGCVLVYVYCILLGYSGLFLHIGCGNLVRKNKCIIFSIIQQINPFIQSFNTYIYLHTREVRFNIKYRSFILP